MRLYGILSLVFLYQITPRCSSTSRQHLYSTSSQYLQFVSQTVGKLNLNSVCTNVESCSQFIKCYFFRLLLFQFLCCLCSMSHVNRIVSYTKYAATSVASDPFLPKFICKHDENSTKDSDYNTITYLYCPFPTSLSVLWPIII